MFPESTSGTTDADRGEHLQHLQSIAAHGLDASKIRVPDHLLSDGSWGHLTAAITRNRLWLLAAEAVTSGQLPVTNEQAEQVFEGELALTATMLEVERSARDVANLYSRIGTDGVEFRVLKGPAHAQRLWRQPCLRGWADFDVIVPEVDLARVADAMVEGLGAKWHDPVLLRTSALAFAKSMTFTLQSGVAVDLHRTLVRGPFGETIPTSELWDASTEVLVAGIPMQAMSSEAMLIHACLHSLSGELSQVTRMRDIAEAVRCDSSVSPDALIAQAERWKCDGVVAAGIRRATEYFMLDSELELTRWAASHQASDKQRRWMGYYANDKSSDRAMLALAIVGATRSWSRRFSYMGNLVFHPGRDPLGVRVRRLVRGH